MIRNILLFITFSVLILFQGTSWADMVDKSVAIVNDDIITLSEVNELGHPLFQKAAFEVPPDELIKVFNQIRSSVIDKLIEKKLLLQESKKMKISVSAQEVDNALELIQQRNNLTREQFSEELKKNDMTEKIYRENLRSQILRSKLVNYEVRSKVVIPEERIIDYYDEHYTERLGDGGYFVLQIGTLWQNGDRAGKQKALEKIKKIHAQAKENIDFKALAREYSELPSAEDGGELGIFKKTEMAPFLRDAVIDLQPGEISRIVEADTSYQFFSLLSSKGDQIITTVPYASVKEEIRKKLHQEETEKRYNEWVKGIREKAYIKIL